MHNFQEQKFLHNSTQTTLRRVVTQGQQSAQPSKAWEGRPFAPVPVTRNSFPSFALLVGPGKNLLVVTYNSELCSQQRSSVRVGNGQQQSRCCAHRSSPAKPTAVMQLHSGMSTRVSSVAPLSPMSHCVTATSPG